VSSMTGCRLYRGIFGASSGGVQGGPQGRAQAALEAVAARAQNGSQRHQTLSTASDLCSHQRSATHTCIRRATFTLPIQSNYSQYTQKYFAL
jgi:hypothetical protein